MNLNVNPTDEESGVSVLSRTVVVIADGSDSNETIQRLPPSKRLRIQEPELARSTRFKGVVPLRNGQWGAEVCSGQRRIWPGSFRSEELAAVAHDRATIKLRQDDPRQNLPWTELSAYESTFQNAYEHDSVIEMIRDGSYDARYAEFLLSAGRRMLVASTCDIASRNNDGGGGVMAHELFQKELTPSDVGKLNRLVIPKKYAVRYFPPIQILKNKVRGSNGGGAAENDVMDGAEGMMLEFRDRQGLRWEFRYCFWRSSQSFVFTKGWNKFVKTKELNSKDTVVFYRCEERGRAARGSSITYCMIDVEYSNCQGGDQGCSTKQGEAGGNDVVRLESEEDEIPVKESEGGGERDVVLMEEERDVVLMEEERDVKEGFMLFGVLIS